MILEIREKSALLRGRYSPIDPETFRVTAEIVERVRAEGMSAIRQYGEHFGEVRSGERIVVERAELDQARDALSDEIRDVLERTADRIARFAVAQRESVGPLEYSDGSIRAGHRWVPVDVAGCYAPGGRYPLPSSVLMTAVTARAAGVGSVWVASPKPTRETLAAASIAGVDGLIRIGGAHAMAALAFGLGGAPRCDMIVGPGNRYVTAAKHLLSAEVGIDMLAGPSELVVVADSSAPPEWIAADLLAQAEHDPDALPILIALDRSLVIEVDRCLARQLQSLDTADIARQSLKNGFATIVDSIEEAAQLSNRLAPEHLQIMVDKTDRLPDLFIHYGAVFYGARSAEVFGDYGAGPNHVLPTSGTARFASGLSVFTFLNARTYLAIPDTTDITPLIQDTKTLAQCEGLLAHKAAATFRE